MKSLSSHQKVLLSIGIPLIFFTMSFLLFREHWEDMAPTPKPKSYVKVDIGEKIEYDFAKFSDKPIFLHFTNPSCKCSTFVKDHIKSLIHKYQEKIQFVIVIESENNDYNTQGVLNIHSDYSAMKTDILFIEDKDGLFAKKVGVYSTPQAVILDESRKLVFRGNYNSSRYSTRENTKYAQNALKAFLEKKSDVSLVKSNYSFGCIVPEYEKKE